ncbi:conserved hypothetical protein [Sporisorium reilianum SRZ2]|uniref:Uncharacterized protein n=1 Tax=Sporisorium reilianum (strain SRZ2) TaxID=999809 RepID=E6ZVB7_SPORE|nr:conserved hypothetical protein [Sporisorium reilianum SRZ2]
MSSNIQAGILAVRSAAALPPPIQVAAPRSDDAKPGDRPAASALQLPGHAIYLADPQRLSVLSINIDATTTITTSRAGGPAQAPHLFPQQPAQLSPSLQPPPSYGHRHASTSKLRSPQPPPSSFPNASPKSSRTRPLSHDFGQRARDALSEFGRLANRRTSAMERANGAETLARVADGLNANGSFPQSGHARRASMQPLPLHQKQLQQQQQQQQQQTDRLANRTPHLHLASDDAVVIQSHATRSFTLLPQRDLRFSSQALPLSIHSSTTASGGEASSSSCPVEFTTEAANAISAISAFDPSQLLLKVQPPAELARESWSRSASFLTAQNASQYETSEQNTIILRFRLRLSRSSTTPTTPSFSRTEGSGAAVAAAEQDQGCGQVLFLSAASPEKLADAIESPQSSIATPELAALEGISRVLVTAPAYSASPAVTRGDSECDFNWTWKSLSRSNLSNGSRCCCAFVELRPDGKAATLLAAMSVYIQQPPPAPSHGGILSTTNAAKPSSAGISRSDSLALIAALNLDQDLSPASAPESLSANSRVGPQSNDGPPGGKQGQSHESVNAGPLLIDRTELSLEDLVSDSPIFRAAVANLERRTTSMKRASKAVLRAAQEARSRTLKLIEAEDAMEAAFEGLVGLAPETLGRLQDQFLRQARSRITQHRREQAAVIETQLERPLNHIVELCRVAQEGFKLFENESKTYYSQTQKWLANRSNFDAPSPALNDDYPATGQKQKSADEKQKLRELRFEQARLDLFVMLQRLHGGRAEAHLTQSILQLSQWLADLPTKLDLSDQEQKSCLSALDAGLRNALDEQASQLQAFEVRSRELGIRIRALEQALGKTAEGDADVVGAHRFELEQEALPPPAANGAISSKARKFKSFLGAFAAGMNNSPLMSSKGASPKPESVEPPKQAELGTVANSEQQPQSDLARRRLSLKLRSDRSQQIDAAVASPSKSQAPSSWRFDNVPAHPRRGSEPHISSQRRDGEASEQLALGLRASAIRDASDGGSSVDHGVESSGVPAAQQGLGIFAPASPSATQGYGSNEGPGASSSSAVKAAIPGGDRRKEGVLWVSTKSITGPAGADAPRGINRSTHWRECWVVLSGSGQVSEYADWKNAKALEPTNPLIDLRFATVREARGVDRRFAFEIVTRDNRRLFQAPDEETMRDWMRAISKAIESLLNGTSSVRKIDRVVRAAPFRNGDSAQRTGALDEYEEEPGMGEGNDFAVRRLLDRTSKGFSQSMTDLSASAKAQGGERKAQPKTGGHLAALSESHAGSSARMSRRGSQHERGISNKTPISGYLGAGGLGLSAVDAAALHRRDESGLSEDGSISSRSANGEQDAEFDRQIEAVIHRSYGSHEGTQTSHSDFSHSSVVAGVDEMGKLKGCGPATGAAESLSPSKRNAAVKQSVSITATSTKMSRSAEIAAISRQPENRRCADCQVSDPRWASWMLANEPCCIFICISCSGVHRSLGVHISKVKSVDLDDWTEEQLQAAREWGNVRANALWEHSKPAGLLPVPGDRKKFWQSKYVEQAWKDPNSRLPAVQSGIDAGQDAAVEDVDATPTRRSAAFNDATPTIASPESKRLDRAKALGLHITSGDQAGLAHGEGSTAKLHENLGSPKPNGPRPLPVRRSVSMQASPVSSPPLSPQGARQPWAIGQGLTSPVSSSKHEQRDWTVHQDFSTRPSEDDDNSEPLARFVAPSTAAHDSPRRGAFQERPTTATTSIPVSASVPHLSSLSHTSPHVSQAMLAARADPRLFPSSSSSAAIATENSNSRLQVSSPPSSFFVSNLNGRTPSPILFAGPARGGEAGWDTASETGTAEMEGTRSVDRSSGHHAPARFEAFAPDA